MYGSTEGPPSSGNMSPSDDSHEVCAFYFYQGQSFGCFNNFKWLPNIFYATLVWYHVI